MFEAKTTKLVNCISCGTTAPWRGGAQKYCVPCSEARHQSRAGVREAVERNASSRLLRGKGISKLVSRRSLVWEPPPVYHEWLVRFKIPFSQAASKNHVWSLAAGGGHVFKRKQSRSFQDLVAYTVQAVTKGVTVYQNKIWVDLFVQKPHHKGDAINVIDVVCDGLKVGLGVDDRWFCLGSVDWEITKNDPQIFVTVSQRDNFDAQACSHCGRILPFESFGKKRTTKNGIDRVCLDCRAPSKSKIVVKPAGVEA